MNRIERLNALLIYLQGKSRITLHEIEDRFEIGRRTVFRDIRSLTEAGVPIGGNAGEGYFIVEGYHLPPVVFNREEAGVLLMGSKFVESGADTETVRTFQMAMDKIKAVLKYSDKKFLETLEKRISIRPSPVPREFPNSHISEIQLAVAANKLISMTYYSHYSNKTTHRYVEPLGMVFYSGRWHLIAYCRLRQDLRDFRADRIQKVEILSEVIDPSKHPNYLNFLNEALMGTDAKEAIISCSVMVTRFMDDQKHYMGFIEEQKQKDGRFHMKFITPHYDYLARWLMMFGDEVEILSPPEFQQIANMLARELAEHHSRVSA
ncbi:MAG: YafY family protein [Bacteroidota bacterium]